MKLRVYALRERGRLLPWRSVRNGPSYIGTLTTYTIKSGERTYRAIRLASGNPAENHDLWNLYEPVLIGFAPNAFRIRGFERVESSDGPVGVVQEWHCEDP